MKLRIHLSILLAASFVLALQSANAHADPIMYYLDAGAVPGDPYVLSGFITTDGAFGTLATTDIIAWGFTLGANPATAPYDVSSQQPGAFIIFYPDAIFATESALVIEPDVEKVLFSGPNFDNSGGIEWGGSSSIAYVDDPITQVSFESQGTEFPLEIASAAVPEPSSILLTLAAIGAGYGGWRRARRKAAEQPQTSPQDHS